MKLAKKTLSVALAAVMAASSFAGTFSAFAGEAVQNSAVKYTAINGTATVKANVTIDATKAAKTADLGDDDEKKAANKSNQIDETTLSSYYSFTPSRTGVYTMKVESTPIYHGYSQAEYSKWADKKGMSDTEKAEKALVYSTKEGELYTDTTFKTKVTAVEDSVVIDNVTSADKVDTVPDAFVTKTTAVSTDKDETKAVLSYKYVEYNDTMKGIVEDKVVKKVVTGTPVTLVNATLTAGKTYYFKATLKEDLIIATKDVDVKVDNATTKYTQVVKTDAYNLASAKITIAQKTGMAYDTTYAPAKDKQKVEVPSGYTVAAGETRNYDQKTNKYYVEKTVQEGATTATYYGYDTTATVADTYQGTKVTKFVNKFGGLQSITLGKNVETVEGLNIAPQLKSVTINNPEFKNVAGLGLDAEKVTLTLPANSAVWYDALAAGYKVNVTCTHKWTTVKAATIFAAGQRKCSECDKVEAIAKKAFAPTAKASKKKIVVKGNAGKVAKLAVWVYDSKGKLVKKQVKKNVTKNTVKVAKAGKYTVKVKAYGTNGAKTASVKKTVKVK